MVAVSPELPYVALAPPLSAHGTAKACAVKNALPWGHG